MDDNEPLDLDHNPGLRPWRAPSPDDAVAGKGTIERPGTRANLVWQTRAAAPGQYEQSLADGLIAAFEAGNTELADVVAHLNAAGVRAVDGAPWTEGSLGAELARLGA